MAAPEAANCSAVHLLGGLGPAGADADRARRCRRRPPVKDKRSSAELSQCGSADETMCSFVSGGRARAEGGNRSPKSALKCSLEGLELEVESGVVPRLERPCWLGQIGRASGRERERARERVKLEPCERLRVSRNSCSRANRWMDGWMDGWSERASEEEADASQVEVSSSAQPPPAGWRR